MGDKTPKDEAKLPPRWFIRIFWQVHRRVVRWSGARLGLWRPKPGGWGAMQVHAVGRRSGKARPVILGYFVDGDDLVTMAMNGWGEAEPAWWLNVQAHPEVTVDTKDERGRAMTAHAAEGPDRDRLWARWQETDEHLDAYAARRPRETAVVVFRPAP
jgi:deazaflavin-dependent oxidoreductase (nitroreductase family)